MVKIDSKVCQAKEIDTADLDGEKVMMNLEKGMYFAMNSIASFIWDIIEHEVYVNEIVKILLENYQISEEHCKNSVIDYLGTLEDAELITVC